MDKYGERDFVRALVPILIGRLPDPLNPSDTDMRLVAEAARDWACRLSDLKNEPEWLFFMLDTDDQEWDFFRD